MTVYTYTLGGGIGPFSYDDVLTPYAFTTDGAIYLTQINGNVTFYGDVSFAGNVYFSGTPPWGWGSDNQVAVWTSGNALEGGNTVYWNGSNFAINAASQVGSLSGDLCFGGTADRAITVQENPSTSTDGADLLIQAGDANSGSTNKNGGTLTLKAGAPTGSGQSILLLKAGNEELLMFDDDKIGFFGATPIVPPTVTNDASSIISALRSLGLLT